MRHILNLFNLLFNIGMVCNYVIYPYVRNLYVHSMHVDSVL